MYKVAGSLLRLRDQLDTGASTRAKASDGTIGNAEHAARDSDHNPWWVYGGVPYVTAMDITHDPVHLDCGHLANVLWASRDPRIKYVIWNGRITAGAAGPDPWISRVYRGTNQHTHHLHLSVMPNPDSLSQRDWNLTGLFTEDDVKADEVWGFPVHDLYTEGPEDTMPAGVAVEWAAANSGHAKDMAEAALRTSQRCEEKLDKVLALLGGEGNKTL
jgi:hypothetical protein